MTSCNHPDCAQAATYWVVRRLAAGYLPNPDVRAYCDDHGFPDVASAVAASHAPVESAEFVTIGSTEPLRS